MRPRSPSASEDFDAAIERAAYLQRLDAFLASRDAARTITLDALRSGITLTAVVEVASDLAEYADEALAIVREEYRPSLHCKEGCSYCCCKPNVLASIPELLRILSHVRVAFGEEARVALRERARRYRAQMKGRRVEDPLNESIPCPLLVEGRCSAYEVRPLICRGYNSTNVDACRQAHEDASVLVPTFAILKDVTSGATVGAAQSLGAEGINDALVDLGTALNVALESGDGFMEAALSGRTDLAPAENTSWVTVLWEDVRQAAQRLGLEIGP